MQDHHFQIVEYERRYAKSIADMWNRSMDSWGGSSKIRTEESIIQEHESSTNLHVFLALAEGEVVGYCSFSHYRNDQGALYIPLLNVRPDYHGKKVGRELILHSVRKTIEMGWPRLDLFTWAGNTKAVPLYKKCGFFWEKRENSTHLMNFIPTVLQSEALMPYFEQIDWYNDLKRNLEIRPDGEKVNGFDLFQYEWEYEGGQQLRIQFEKTGRGIRLIETEDYMIHTDIESHELVFGRSYTVRYTIRNKTGKPLHCVVKGLDDKNVRFSFEASVEVTDEAIVEGKFTVEPVAEEQNDWKTHPAVASDWLINGQSVQFRSGILPKFPATIAFTAPEEESFMQVTKDCYITLKNECKQPALFEFTIPQSDLVEFAEYTHRLSLPAGGQQTISIPYRLYDYGLYSANLSVTASMESGEQISFEKRIDCIFKGQTGLFGGETEQQWAIVNGLMTVYLNKSNNDMWTHHFKDSYNTWWMYPRLGRPYSSEFSLQKASDVNIFKEEQNIVMQAYYDSLDFPGLIFISITKLSANGLIEHYFEVENIADVETGDEVYLNESFYHSLDKGVLPYEGEFFNLEKENVRDSDYWNIDHISENWLFSNGSHLTRGFCWHPSQKLVKSDWHFAIEHSLGKLSAGQKVRTHSTFLAIGTFTDWFDFRSFAQKKREQVKPALSDHLELMVNSGNPIVSDGFSVEVKDRKTSYLDGEIAVCSSKDLFTTQHKRVDTNEQTRSINFDVLLNTVTSATDIVRMSYNASHLQCERNKVVFITSSDALCTSNMTEDEGREVYSVDNGAIRYRACATYGHGLFSFAI